MSTYIIAEAGVNHNGSLDLARQLIDAAAEAGADAVKFQTFRADALASPTAPKAAYQQQTTDVDESQHAMLKALELSEDDHHALIEHCRERAIQFLSTPFDEESLSLLVDVFNMPRVKVPSGEITNAPLLLAVARAGRPVIVSTGMSLLGEVEEALGVLAFGMTTDETALPGLSAFRAAYASKEGQHALQERVLLLHCTSAYPTPPEEVNLRAMDTLHAAFGLPVGFSDHTQGIAIPTAAAARGAVLVEKHFTIDRTLPGPDHRASLEPDELAAMVAAIRSVEQALGDGRKVPTPSELDTRNVARRSLATARAVEEGGPLDHLIARRPGTGRSPMRYWDESGSPAPRIYKAGELI